MRVFRTGPALFLFFCVVVLGSCATTSAQYLEPDPVVTETVVSRWEGAYSVNFAPDGRIEDWVLFTDGTFAGSWKSWNESAVFLLEGTYTLNDSILVFDAGGRISFTTRDERSVRISGGGMLDNSQGRGFFTLVSTDLDVPNDIGTWGLTRKR